MQFLVYLLTILMVAISTVLLEVHWLASPDPQPKPIIQAGPPPPPKTEGPNEALSPIYPKKVEAPRPAEPANSQSQDAPPNAVQTTGPAAPRLITPQQQSAATTTVAPAQEPGPPAQAVQQSAPPPAQQPATAQTTGSMVAAQPAAPPQQTVTAPQGAPPQPSGANAASQQESLRETTGAVVREENTRQASADPTRSPSRANNSQQNVPNSSSNRCDIQACAGTYRSFRANDCTYQPFDGGPRRLCEKSLGQRMARERDQPDRRRWRGHGDTLPRPLEGGPAVP
jgi:BA14K-like protein